MTEGKKRGRRPIHTTDEAKAAARRDAKAKFKNVSIDADLVDALNAVADDLERQFGFRPTLSQTLRHLIKGAAK
jgi:hypothetical protein